MVQRRATRCILSSYSPYQSVTELQQQLNLRTLEQRRVDAKVIMFNKIIHGLVAIPILSYFEQPMRSTRHFFKVSKHGNSLSKYRQFSIKLHPDRVWKPDEGYLLSILFADRNLGPLPLSRQD